ncbi:uncharacterized protein AMSG_07659 [Thecamonas trahens ATCC 50062]|uniref:Uncharacterized protein n=1 Tax=Thecamonas trahens ATCC 50062 TaxID=461836 RepID=A0A0L0DJI3_THETB|nr:hypothetical protein AMSG_07659 [Thecamonas trahens ATCC 50062]KNC51463.1 hypothetical protein AMSG_07659 [Thecamonas trahens ATCC 50062]|eukprot:XP_013756125.1 hypothetical protein AMSG_07659 [Thecamonas trahens ATCC 50062]
MAVRLDAWPGRSGMAPSAAPPVFVPALLAACPPPRLAAEYAASLTAAPGSVDAAGAAVVVAALRAAKRLSPDNAAVIADALVDHWLPVWAAAVAELAIVSLFGFLYRMLTASVGVSKPHTILERLVQSAHSALTFRLVVWTCDLGIAAGVAAVAWSRPRGWQTWAAAPSPGIVRAQQTLAWIRARVLPHSGHLALEWGARVGVACVEALSAAREKVSPRCTPTFVLDVALAADALAAHVELTLATLAVACAIPPAQLPDTLRAAAADVLLQVSVRRHIRVAMAAVDSLLVLQDLALSDLAAALPNSSIRMQRDVVAAIRKANVYAATHAARELGRPAVAKLGAHPVRHLLRPAARQASLLPAPVVLSAWLEAEGPRGIVALLDVPPSAMASETREVLVRTTLATVVLFAAIPLREWFAAVLDADLAATADATALRGNSTLLRFVVRAVSLAAHPLLAASALRLVKAGTCGVDDVLNAMGTAVASAPLLRLLGELLSLVIARTSRQVGVAFFFLRVVSPTLIDVDPTSADILALSRSLQNLASSAEADARIDTVVDAALQAAETQPTMGPDDRWRLEELVRCREALDVDSGPAPTWLLERMAATSV